MPPPPVTPVSRPRRPPPWPPKVVNVGDGSGPGGLTISVNNNWFNGFNLSRVNAFLGSELLAVREALEHLREGMSREGEREWERQCEVIMRANSALDLTSFASLVIDRARALLAGDDRACFPGPSTAATGSEPSGGGDQDDMAPGSAPGPRGAGETETPGGNRRSTAAGSRVEGGSPPDTPLLRHGRGSAWDHRWRVLSLEQAAGVLERLVQEPFSSHLFLDAGGESLAGGEGGAVGARPDGDAERTERERLGGADLSRVRDVLASIGDFLRDDAARGRDGRERSRDG